MTWFYDSTTDTHYATLPNGWFITLRLKPYPWGWRAALFGSIALQIFDNWEREMTIEGAKVWVESIEWRSR